MAHRRERGRGDGRWDYLTAAQKHSLEELFSFGCPFTFADSEDPVNQFDALMMAAPQVRQIWKGAWEGEVEIQEI